MSAAARVRALLADEKTSSLPDKELAALAGCSLASAKMAKSRLRKPLKQRNNESRIMWLEARLHSIETTIEELRQQVTK